MTFHDPTPAPRNADRVMNLVTAGVLPPELQLPESLYQHMSYAYPRWFGSLPERTKLMALPYLSNCDLSEQLKEVGKGRGRGSPRAPLTAPSALETPALLGCVCRIQGGNSEQRPGQPNKVTSLLLW